MNRSPLPCAAEPTAAAILTLLMLALVPGTLSAQEPNAQALGAQRGRLVVAPSGQPLQLAKKKKVTKPATPKEPASSEDPEEPEEGEPEAASDASADAPQLGGGLRRSNRMEFDARLIRGETAGSGAVFLFQRAPRPLPSMVPLRTSYLHETVDQRLGERYAQELTQAKAQALKDELKQKTPTPKNNAKPK